MNGYILIDEIPSDCMECDFGIDYCCALQKTIYSNFSEQKEHCPIRPLPNNRKTTYQKGYKSGYNNGWNDCIDAIVCGEEDE